MAIRVQTVNARVETEVPAKTPFMVRDSPFARQAEAKRLKKHSPAGVDELTAYLNLNPIDEDAVDPFNIGLSDVFNFQTCRS